LRIFGFGLQEVQFFFFTSVIFIIPHVGVRQPAYQNQAGSSQVCTAYGSEFN